MKKILISVVLAVISLIIGTFSFIINDLPSYHRWMADNGPKMMENFKGWSKDRKDFKNGPANDRMREDLRNHHDQDSMGPDRNMPGDHQDNPKENKREAPDKNS